MSLNEAFSLLTDSGTAPEFTIENKFNPNGQTVSASPSTLGNMCRICCGNGSASYLLKPIFSDIVGNLLEMIKTISDVEVSPNDGLPSSICLPCERRFLDAFDLRLMTQRSEEIFRNFLTHGTLTQVLVAGQAAKPPGNDDDTFHTVFLPELQMELKQEVVDIDDLAPQTNPDVVPSAFLPLLDVPFVLPEPQLPPVATEPVLKTETAGEEVVPPVKLEPRSHKEKPHKASRSHRKKHKKIKVEKAEDESGESKKEVVLGDVESVTKRRRRDVKSYREEDDEEGRSRKEKAKKPTEQPQPTEVPEFFDKIEVKQEQLDDYGDEEEDEDDNSAQDTDGGGVGESRKKSKRPRTVEESCDSIVCHVCGKSNFKKASYLKRHIRDMHSEQELECDQCDKKFSTPGSLNVHKKVVHEKRRYHCDQCNRVYITSRDLHVHTLQAHYIGDPKYECEICGAKYKHPFLLRLHKHRSKNYPTHGAGRPGQETRTTNFKCTACDIPYFDCLVSYREHRREHDNKYVCKLCGHTVTTDNLLRAHIRLHNKKYTCDLCEYKTTSMYNLQRHKISHTGVKPFPCTICDKGFTRNEQLKNHLKSHGMTGTANSGDEKLTQNALEYYNNILRYHGELGKPPNGTTPPAPESLGTATPQATTPVPTPSHMQQQPTIEMQQQQLMQQLPTTIPQ